MKRMKSILAVSFAVLGLSLAAPAQSALACGGYVRVEPEEHSSIRQAIQRHVERRADIDGYQVTSIELDDFRVRATVVLRYRHARSGGWLQQTFSVRYRGDEWRVVARDRAVQV